MHHAELLEFLGCQVVFLEIKAEDPKDKVEDLGGVEPEPQRQPEMGEKRVGDGDLGIEILPIVPAAVEDGGSPVTRDGPDVILQLLGGSVHPPHCGRVHPDIEFVFLF